MKVFILDIDNNRKEVGLWCNISNIFIHHNAIRGIHTDCEKIFDVSTGFQLAFDVDPNLRCKECFRPVTIEPTKKQG